MRSRTSLDQIENLLGSVGFEEYQRLAVFGVRLHKAFFDCYHNGPPPVLPEVRYDVATIAARTIADRLARPTKASPTQLKNRT